MLTFVHQRHEFRQLKYYTKPPGSCRYTRQTQTVENAHWGYRSCVAVAEYLCYLPMIIANNPNFSIVT